MLPLPHLSKQLRKFKGFRNSSNIANSIKKGFSIEDKVYCGQYEGVVSYVRADEIGVKFVTGLKTKVFCSEEIDHLSFEPTYVDQVQRHEYIANNDEEMIEICNEEEQIREVVALAYPTPIEAEVIDDDGSEKKGKTPLERAQTLDLAIQGLLNTLQVAEFCEKEKKGWRDMIEKLNKNFLPGGINIVKFYGKVENIKGIVQYVNVDHSGMTIEYKPKIQAPNQLICIKFPKKVNSREKAYAMVMKMIKNATRGHRG